MIVTAASRSLIPVLVTGIQSRHVYALSDGNSSRGAFTPRHMSALDFFNQSRNEGAAIAATDLQSDTEIVPV